MNRSRTKPIWLIFLSLLISVSGACQETDRPTTGPMSFETRPTTSQQAGTTITFAVPNALHSAFSELARQFEAENHNISVRVVDLDALLHVDQTQGTDDALLRVAQGADTMIWRWPAEYRGQPLLLDLAPFIQADQAFKADDFYPGLLNGDAQGQIYWIPANVGLVVLFYNKALFDAAGLPYPQPGWTQEEFLKTAMALTKQDPMTGETRQYGFLDTGPQGLDFVLSLVGTVVDSGSPTPALHLDSPAMVKAVQRYMQLVGAGVTPALGTLDQESYLQEAERLITAGQVAIWTDVVDNLGYRAQHQAVGVVTFPRPDPDSGVFYYPGTRYAISIGTAHPEAAWRWLSWLSRQDVHTLFPYTIPPRHSLVESNGIWSSLPEDLAASYQWALAHPATGWSAGFELFVAFPPSVRNQIYSTLQRALGQVAQGQVTVEAALAEAQRQAMEVVKNSAGSGTSQPTPVVVVTPTAIPSQAGVTPITFVTTSYASVPALQKVALEFQKIEPGIQVQVQRFQLPPGTGTFQMTLQSLAEQGNCFGATGGSSLLRDDLSAVLNLDPLLEADPTFDLDDFYPITLDLLRRNGKLWGLPGVGIVRLLYYNRDLFDRSGIPYPRSGWTVDDWLTTAQALRRAQTGAGEYPYLSFDERLDAEHFLAQMGATRYIPGTTPPQPQFDSEAVLRAVKWYLDLARVDQIKPQYAFVGPDNLPGWDTNLALVNEGRIAMWATLELGMGSPYTTTLNVGVVPMPHNPDGLNGPGSYISSDAYFISARADPAQVAACWRWITYLTTRPDLLNGLAPRRSVFASGAYRSRFSEDLYAAYAQVLDQEGEQTRPASDESSSFFLGAPDHWFWQAVDQAVAGQELSLALWEAQHKAEEYIACMATGEGGDLESRSVSCAQQIDPDYPEQP